MGLLISNLRKYFSDKGVRDYIINALFDIKPESSKFYVPQLCYLALVYPDSFLVKLLPFQCSKNVEFFLLVR